MALVGPELGLFFGGYLYIRFGSNGRFKKENSAVAGPLLGVGEVCDGVEVGGDELAACRGVVGQS